MNLGIGVLAHNEEQRLPRMLRSLAAQSIFEGVCPDLRQIYIACVPNGCTDNTPMIADEVMRDIVSSHHSHGHRLGFRLEKGVHAPGARIPTGAKHEVMWDVFVLDKPGKARAWNVCVHELLPTTCDIICMIDADIWFPDADVIDKCLNALVTDERCLVATDYPRKAFRGAAGRVFRSLSRAGSALTDSGLCGQFYCARASALRRVYMPPGLPVEDGFLHAAIVTDGFRKAPARAVVRHVPETHHFYEPCTSFHELLRHEERLIVGTILNRFLFDHLAENTQDTPLAEYIRARQAEDPAWYDRLMAKYIAAGPRWLISSRMLVRRFRRPGGCSWLRYGTRLPLRLVAFLFDLVAFCRANRRLRRGRAVAFW